MSLPISIGGIPVGLKKFQWALTSGVKPETRVLTMPIARAQSIFALGIGPHPLKIGTDSYQVYILDLVPAGSPHTAAVIIADQRWQWNRIVIARSFNVRRKTGKSVLLAGRPEVAPLDPDEAYAPWSLDGSAAFTPRSALVSILKKIQAEIVGGGGAIRVPETLRQVPLEGVEPTGSADMAVLRLLQYLPGFNVTIDPDNGVRIYDTRDGSDGGVLSGAGGGGSPGGTRTRAQQDAAGPLIHIGTGYAGTVSRARLSPARVHVLIEREVEIRCDHDEDAAKKTRVRGREEPTLENVAQLTDLTLTVDGGPAVRSEWHPIGDSTALVGGLLFAFEQDALNPRNSLFSSALGPLSQANLRKFAFPAGRDLLVNYSLSAGGAPDQVWSSRVNEILARWRRTFRLSPKFRDKIISWRPYRVAVINPERGTRAPSPVYTDYIVRPAIKGLIKRVSQRTDRGWTITGYADDLANAKPGPFLVRVVDQDQVVFNVEGRPDPWGEAESVFAGKVLNFPTMDLAKLSDPVQIAANLATWNQVELESGWKMSTVISVVPASPNNEGRYHRTTIEAGAVGAAGAAGPDWTVIVSGAYVPALFGWKDSKRTEILASIWEGGQLSADLLVNPEQVKALAEASARRIYSLFTDRVEGAFSTPLSGVHKPTGSMRTVTHYAEVGEDGRVVAGSLLQFPPILEPINIDAFLPESILRAVKRLVQP